MARPRFRKACDARAIDFDPNFARLAALSSQKIRNGRTVDENNESWAARLLGAALGLLAAAAPAVGAGRRAANYPNKPIRVIVPFAAGGGNDIFARLVGQKLSEILGQPVINENKPGAGGRIAAEYVMNQPHDGYTLFIGASGVMSVAAAAYPNLSYHPTKTFIPLSMIANFPLIMVVPAGSSGEERQGTGRVGEEESRQGELRLDLAGLHHRDRAAQAQERHAGHR